MISSNPPKRFESEVTVVIDREKLPPKPTPLIAADLDEFDDMVGPTVSQLDDCERARREAKERPTLMECPWCRVGMVAPEQRAAWLDAYPELEPPPDSQPDLDPPPKAA